jgi:ATP-dependent Clp protease adapter protein ClpS
MMGFRQMKKTPLETTGSETDRETDLGNPWQVVLFNDEVHSFDEVILQIQKATGYPLPRAAELTLRVHQNGKASIFFGTREACEKVDAVLGAIKLLTRVEKT